MDASFTPKKAMSAIMPKPFSPMFTGLISLCAKCAITNSGTGELLSVPSCHIPLGYGTGTARSQTHHNGRVKYPITHGVVEYLNRIATSATSHDCSVPAIGAALKTILQVIRLDVPVGLQMHHHQPHKNEPTNQTTPQYDGTVN
jgi:hypothetical protein